MKETHQLCYATPQSRSGHSPYGVASVSLGLSTVLWFLILCVDPSQSLQNERPIKAAAAAGILGITLALGALRDIRKELILAVIGLALNVLTSCAAGLVLSLAL
jgi:hypothetical protein